jgi:hypothetical protein
MKCRGASSLLLESKRGLVSNLYIFIGILAFAVAAIGVVVSRVRKTPSFDHVPQNVLNRIRTEYR